MKKTVNFFKKSVLFENPAISLFVGIVPLLAASTKLVDGVFMGVSAAVCVIVSSFLFWVLRKFIPYKLKDIVYIIIAASVVSLCELLIRAYFPAVYKSLGIYLPLLCVGGLVFSRSKKFEKQESLTSCMLEGASCAVGYFAAIVAMSVVREFFGRGTFAGLRVIPEQYAVSLLAGPVGGFILLGILVAVFGKFFKVKKSEEERK